MDIASLHSRDPRFHTKTCGSNEHLVIAGWAASATSEATTTLRGGAAVAVGTTIASAATTEA